VYSYLLLSGRRWPKGVRKPERANKRKVAFALANVNHMEASGSRWVQHDRAAGVPCRSSPATEILKPTTGRERALVASQNPHVSAATCVLRVACLPHQAPEATPEDARVSRRPAPPSTWEKWMMHRRFSFEKYG